MLIQCTKKLLDELKVKPELSVDEDELYSWHANLITLKRRKAVVLVNDKNNYSIVLYGLKAKDFKNLDSHLQNAIRETFQKETIKDEVIEKYLSSSPKVTYSKTRNRSTISKLNIVCSEVPKYEDLICDSMYQGALGVKLSRTACKSGYKKIIMPYEELYRDLRALSASSIFSMVRPVNRVLDYIISMTNLYGLVYKGRVLEVYNQQNQGQIDEETIKYVMDQCVNELENNNIRIHLDYFVSWKIAQNEDLEELLKLQRDKPFYIPTADELQLYKDKDYFEATEQYNSLAQYIQRNILHKDPDIAQKMCRDIHEICSYKFSLRRVLKYFKSCSISFKSEKQLNIVLSHIIEAANHTRVFEHNGHTPEEINLSLPKNKITSLLRRRLTKVNEIPVTDSKALNKSNKKTGRNDPCPCGSGIKYKKCCLNKAC